MRYGTQTLVLKPFLLAQGISHRRSCPHTHQQMGTVERRHRHIVDLGIALLTVTDGIIAKAIGKDQSELADLSEEPESSSIAEELAAGEELDLDTASTRYPTGVKKPSIYLGDRLW